MILEPIDKRKWPPGYSKRVARVRDQLSLSEVEPLGSPLLDLALDED